MCVIMFRAIFKFQFPKREEETGMRGLASGRCPRGTHSYWMASRGSDRQSDEGTGGRRACS